MCLCLGMAATTNTTQLVPFPSNNICCGLVSKRLKFKVILKKKMYKKFNEIKHKMLQ